MTRRHFFSTGLPHLLGISLMVGLTSQRVLAQPPLEPSKTPLNLAGMCSSTVAGITDTDIQQAELSEPSLWWIRDQLAAQNKYGDRLVDGWLACTGTEEPNRVDVVVNAQLWSLLDFFDRYEFIQKFGTATTGYGYNLRVFDPQGGMLAAYTCNFNSDVATKDAEKAVDCTTFDNLARSSFWSPTKPTFGF
ncbi:MAG: hypothetical protein MUC48_13910 [Leptolyngbya sp. Prado105]|jgi:hypothetical protein|nr:hypothetical protein [Leptolyngbya sp. Prado105]